MKLFAFVRRARRTSSAPVPVALENATAPVSAAEKRRRRPSSGSSSWKPTLVAISEDAAVAAAKADAGKAKGKAKGKPAAAKAKARASPRALRPDCDDFRRFGAPTVLPAFAPTAFLF
ncbi:hypothetical protein CFC21_016470 [Triticum aestivum]|uniref:Uncharacterized protein n=2 Tax=Triticum aestivum TaxID=4565 RepID=A0A3B6AW17_WHEAT|nr:hypothetical protein CFC21_016470 [Triticum aestivum]